jgi:E3 ubiquitin-protein ligase BAH
MCVLDLTCISCLTRDKDYFAQRLREERSVMVKQAKEYWDSQAMLSMGI